MSGSVTDFWATVNALRSFNSNASLVSGDSFPFSVDFVPAEKAFAYFPPLQLLTWVRNAESLARIEDLALATGA
mgnify:CR=1 FL=1